MVNIDPAAWLELGLEFVGFYERRQKVRYKTNLERFTSHYGASPETLQAIFNDFQTTDINDAHIARPDPMLLLMATFWLRTYAKETHRWLGRSTATFQKTVSCERVNVCPSNSTSYSKGTHSVVSSPSASE